MHHMPLYITYYPLLCERICVQGERCMLEASPRVTSSVPKLLGRTAWYSGRSLEPSRVASSSDLDNGWGYTGQALALHLPHFNSIRMSGIDLSDLTDCTVALGNAAKALARNSDVSRLDSRSVENLVRRASKTRVVLIPNIERQEAEGSSMIYGGCFCHGICRGNQN